MKCIQCDNDVEYEGEICTDCEIENEREQLAIVGGMPNSDYEALENEITQLRELLKDAYRIKELEFGMDICTDVGAVWSVGTAFAYYQIHHDNKSDMYMVRIANNPLIHGDSYEQAVSICQEHFETEMRKGLTSV